MHEPPVQEHVDAPLQFTVQNPPVQFVIVHDDALWHVSMQLPPVQSTVQLPPVQVETQLPPGQLVMAHDVVFVQVC